MNTSARNRLTQSAVKSEQLRLRQEQHGKMIRKLADSMADHATEAMAKNQKAALVGDELAIHKHYRAAEGRYRARRISGARA